jgi:hypothetical protein
MPGVFKRVVAWFSARQNDQVPAALTAAGLVVSLFALAGRRGHGNSSEVHPRRYR